MAARPQPDRKRVACSTEAAPGARFADEASSWCSRSGSRLVGRRMHANEDDRTHECACHVRGIRPNSSMSSIRQPVSHGGRGSRILGEVERLERDSNVQPNPLPETITALRCTVAVPVCSPSPGLQHSHAGERPSIEFASRLARDPAFRVTTLRCADSPSHLSLRSA